MVGLMMASLDCDTAREAGTTPDNAGQALATTYPAAARALGKKTRNRPRPDLACSSRVSSRNDSGHAVAPVVVRVNHLRRTLWPQQKKVRSPSGRSRWS